LARFDVSHSGQHFQYLFRLHNVAIYE
jgi:hypothetical protein